MYTNRSRKVKGAKLTRTSSAFNPLSGDMNVSRFAYILLDFEIDFENVLVDDTLAVSQVGFYEIYTVRQPQEKACNIKKGLPGFCRDSTLDPLVHNGDEIFSKRMVYCNQMGGVLN